VHVARTRINDTLVRDRDDDDDMDQCSPPSDTGGGGTNRQRTAAMPRRPMMTAGRRASVQNKMECVFANADSDNGENTSDVSASSDDARHGTTG
jgi:hypothetical protein